MYCSTVLLCINCCAFIQNNIPPSVPRPFHMEHIVWFQKIGVMHFKIKPWISSSVPGYHSANEFQQRSLFTIYLRWYCQNVVLKPVKKQVWIMLTRSLKVSYHHALSVNKQNIRLCEKDLNLELLLLRSRKQARTVKSEIWCFSLRQKTSYVKRVAVQSIGKYVQQILRHKMRLGGKQWGCCSGETRCWWYTGTPG